MKNLTLYRERIIPKERILLKDDIILENDGNVLVTKWHALKPKPDLHHGFSCYFLDKGYKVSKFYKEDNSLLYIYCDIIDYSYSEDKTELNVLDLLADVVIYPDGFVKVVDIGEFVEALDADALSIVQLKKALRTLDLLLEIVYKKDFDALTKYIDKYEE